MGIKNFLNQRLSNYINRRVYKSKLKVEKWQKVHTKFFRIVNIPRKYDNVPLKKRLEMYRNDFRSDDYINYGLTKENMKDYVTEYERWVARDINGEYRIVFDNKNIFYEMFKDYFKIPHNVGILEKGIIHDDFGNEIDIDELIEKYKKVVIKPTVGGGGRAIHMLSKKNKNTYIYDDNEIKRDELVEKLNSCETSIINNFVIQHEYAKKLYPNSTNTIRVITIKDPETGKIIIPYAIQRIGNKKSGQVDNVCSGGFFAHVDIETGTIKKARSYDFVEKLSVHPDTNAQIEGVVIPHWDEVKEKLISVATKFSYIPFVAWDVVITEDGFEVIEGNASSGLGIIQMEEGIKNTKLGEFYKHYNVFLK